MRLALSLLIALTPATCDEGNVPPRRGPFAFHYSASLTDEQLAWYSRFELLVTHDPLPPEQVARLHGAGTRLVLYEWAAAFYDTRATEWQRGLLGKKEHLLNESPLTGGAGSESAGAWYFDPMSMDGRAAEIARRLERRGYDGVFLDATTVANVHPQARKEYERRHPETPYDAAFSRFLRQLRRELPSGIIFTNQGYRQAEHYLPWVDWDLTESLITGQGVRAWNDRDDPWNSIHYVMTNMIEPAMKRHPKVRFGHLNYGADAETIRIVVAVAHLFGGEGFVAAPATADEADPIYFRDPGKPVSRRIDIADGTVSYRCFEHGLIAVTSAAVDVPIAACGETVVLRATGGEPRAYFTLPSR